ncbi:MAG: Signal transduction histidine kinase [Candidatus Roizmanbacteria bacterium GW2011_GWA2_34_18]|uniref:histidine kinase n=1 Tax=Candidatus Roizmanbacteria bacterium GW2011_GWA2_34_18 TaxID=1618477 RepID=A0A0G0ARS3_9BACT|nr:MAG: Signal transduction histidine kinase [Candidatus Roizmanbacteria bacterium GW2011_GWA2_34_18]
MRKPVNSLIKKLFFWYVGSLALLAIFIVLVVHVFAFKNGFYFILLLFLTLALFGFIIIYKITESLTYLSSRMRMISSKNLDERVDGIDSHDEIGELAQTFNQLLDRLHLAFKREQQFIADVAHELKTPLATLRSTLEIALNQKRSEDEYRRTLKEAVQETNRVSTTLKNVLDLAWSETPMEQKNAVSFNLSELTEELFELAQKMALKKNIKVSGSFAKNIKIIGFKEKLGRALLNIIDNAIKYTPTKDKVEIVLKKNKNQATIEIKDNGIGISQKDISHIFDRFYRGSAREKTFGSGLGLAIAKAIVNSHKGAIEVKSEIGKGTVFTINLPLVSS